MRKEEEKYLGILIKKKFYTNLSNLKGILKIEKYKILKLIFNLYVNEKLSQRLWKDKLEFTEEKKRRERKKLKFEHFSEKNHKKREKFGT